MGEVGDELDDVLAEPDRERERAAPASVDSDIRIVRGGKARVGVLGRECSVEG